MIETVGVLGVGQMATATAAPLLVSSCPFCLTMFEDGIKTGGPRGRFNETAGLHQTGPGPGIPLVKSGIDVVPPVARPHHGALGASYGIIANQYPTLGSAKSGHLFILNQVVKREPVYVPDLTIDEYYRYLPTYSVYRHRYSDLPLEHRCGSPEAAINCSMLGTLKHEIAPSVAGTDQGELDLSYRVAPYIDPAIGPLKCDYFVCPNQIIQHVFRDDLFLTVGKNNRHSKSYSPWTAVVSYHPPPVQLQFDASFAFIS